MCLVGKNVFNDSEISQTSVYPVAMYYVKKQEQN